MTPRQLVERFYNEVWNDANEAVAREILRPDFQFKASLGPERLGVDGFVAYMREIHTALGNYRCEIEDLVESDTRVAARMRFHGVHQGLFFGVPATGKRIQWAGAAFFTIEHPHIAELWVLGDIDAVRRQLGAGAASSFEP